MTTKKALRAAALAALLLPCCFAFAFAGSARGTSAFQFLQLGVGARPSALGETFTGVADDVNAVYWNPAGLAHLGRRELSLTHALWLEDITYSNLACALPVGGGTVAAAFNALNTGAIRKADNTGLRQADSYTMSDVIGMVSYARARGRLALGANLKYISSRIEEETAHSYAADLGALYSGFRPWGRKLNVGFAAQNIGTKAKYVAEEFPLPVTLRAGGSLALSKSLLLASDLTYTEKDINLHAGAEYTRAFGAFLVAARAGYKGDTVKELGALSGLTAGLGVNWNDCQIDYAWNSFTDLGITHRISLGIKFAAPAPEAEPPAPAPVAVPAPAPVIADIISAPADTDADGVTDPFDKCPGTSTGTVVDAIGCPLDTDADGVTDYFDKCPDTSTGMIVNAFGCPLDTDADGVTDSLDKCPGTSTGTVVDAVGCPLDTDTDGVANYLDKCPGTSPGTAIDATGCPLDADGDGVLNSLDTCPGTPTGVVVDAAGCQVGTKVELQAIDRLALVAAPGSVTPGVVDAVLGAAGDPACHWDQAEKLCLKLLIEFDYDKAKLRGAFARQLKEIAAFMSANPGARIELQGHTDDHGTNEYNIRLSNDRASSVMKHFIEVNGLAAGRLSFKGIGKAQPAVSNLTEEGRQINRRVIAVLTMGETTQQVKR